MPMLQAGMAVAALLIGAIATFLGVVVTASALTTGAISLSYGGGDGAVSETITRAGDAARYWQFVLLLGVAPAVLGALAARWAWRAINR